MWLDGGCPKGRKISVRFHEPKLEGACRARLPGSGAEGTHGVNVGSMLGFRSRRGWRLQVQGGSQEVAVET